MPTTLIVVDMQPDFEAAFNPNVVIAVTEQILLAKRNKWAIILLEYAGCYNSHQGYNDLLKGYPKKARISKEDDDGSLEVSQAIRRRKFPFKNLRLCGVNTDACVWETVVGLLNRYEQSRVEVVKSACGWEGHRQYDWREYMRHPRLTLV